MQGHVYQSHHLTKIVLPANARMTIEENGVKINDVILAIKEKIAWNQSDPVLVTKMERLGNTL